jgi:hypothetical protein
LTHRRERLLHPAETLKHDRERRVPAASTRVDFDGGSQGSLGLGTATEREEPLGAFRKFLGLVPVVHR